MASGENVPVVGMVPAVRSSLEVAIWFFDRAESANRALDALTLQQFLYLAQTEYAKANNGRKLMPATFLATNTGPLEPTVYHVFERGRPNLRTEHPSFEVSDFLMDIWRRYAAMASGDLTSLVNGDLHYKHAFDQGRNHEISINALRIVPERPEPESEPEPKREMKPDTAAGPGKNFEPALGDDELVSYSPTGKPATRWVPGVSKARTAPRDGQDS